MKSIHTLKDENLWNRLAQDDCETTRKLIVSALTRSHNLPVETGFPTAPVSMQWLQRRCQRRPRTSWNTTTDYVRRCC